jgi:hypothetical protein
MARAFQIPNSQRECTVQIRLFVQAQTTTAIDKFRKAIFYNGMQGYCGLHLAMDWRTMDPKPFVKYFPALVSQEKVALSVAFVVEEEGKRDGEKHKQSSAIPVPRDLHTASPPKQYSYEHSQLVPLTSFGPTIA